MFARQFINLVMKDLRVGGSYWLSRMMPEENLFYPSVVEAGAQTSQGNRENRMTSPPFTSTLDLPGPVARFKSSRTASSTLDFMPFYGRDGEGKIVAIDSTGHAVLHDADAADDDYVGSTVMLPRLNASKWRSPISVCVTTANPGAAKDHYPEALYALNMSNSSDFEALVYCNPPGSGRNDEDKAWHWRRLPPPPYLDDPACRDRTIQSYTLLQDGKTICISSVPGDGGFGTYCFDTSTHQWTNVGRWSLPFSGRALHVPELHGLWFGFLGEDQQKLGAVDLSSLDSAPKVLHEWGGFAPPEDWSLVYSEMVYLGAKRFCIAKTFDIYDRGQLVDTASVLIGVEIVNGAAKKAMLRMKHKSICFDTEWLKDVVNDLRGIYATVVFLKML
ncbi:uncharacterized protein [Aegilops tauschii subsp. strangulata]|uniref:uncharacterized protein n=1 Tax=Aegilops tauschii subsp. strangulata TaxID=200361 RepID=UPI003CC87F65